MRIYISTDLEGVCGVYRFEQTRQYGTPANLEARRLLMGEINAAVCGAFEGGATRVVVRDGHDGSKSFIPEELDERAEMVMGVYSPYDAVLRQGFDGAFLIGYHSMSHTPRGVLCHTQSSLTWDNYWINGKPAGEIYQTAILLGSCDIPVLMVTGDDKTVQEAREFLGDDIVTVQVKTGLSREGALMYSPKRARAMIREGAKEAMKRIGKIKPCKPKFPLRIRWRFKDSGIVDRYKGDARRIDATTLEKIVTRPEDIIFP
ncbi:MAG: peptidase M55 D-aminopeptidase [Candidatus Bathyarchaeota archaeon B26-2]|nr:MAG: peptidase M55 D-aminopeptidase [Candidatus Bathyarchaeota archaeon B26-2]